MRCEINALVGAVFIGDVPVVTDTRIQRLTISDSPTLTDGYGGGNRGESQRTKRKFPIVREQTHQTTSKNVNKSLTDFSSELNDVRRKLDKFNVRVHKSRVDWVRVE